jgi:hypothetical protein
MVEPLSVSTDGVRSLSEIHTRVAAGLGSLTASAPGSAAVGTSHGAVAYAVQTALTAALGSRSGTITTTQGSGARISELLAQAAVAYEQGDQRGAAAIKAAAAAIAEGVPGGSGAPATGGAAASSGAGSEAVGQVVGQVVGQLGQLGQVGQQLGAPLSALGQPLQQLPQQVMQGVGQVAQSAGTAGTPGTPETGDSQRPDGEADEPAAGAESGAAPGTGTAPVAAGDQTGDDGTRRAN